MTSDVNLRSVAQVVCVFLSMLVPPAPVPAQEPMIVGEGGRTRANVCTRIAVSGSAADKPVIVDIIDPWGRTIWTGASWTGTADFMTRDWADGTYTARFDGGEIRFRVATEAMEQVRSRAGLMLRHVDGQRDPDGIAPAKLRGVGNLLQRIMTLFVLDMPEQKLAEQLAWCEQQVGFRTDTGTARLLGSGSSDFNGYAEPYRPFARERTSMFMPPDAVFDFAANAERKLERWGYSVRDVEHVFISHSHADHFDADAIVRFAQRRREAGRSPLVVHAGEASCRQLRTHAAMKDGGARLIVLDLLAPGRETTAGELRVKAVEATHTADSSPLCYIIHWRGTTAYYGTDTGYPKAATIEALAAERFDLFAHEITVASGDDGVTHMDLGDFVLLVGRLRAAGAIGPWTRVVSIHFSPEGPHHLTDHAHWERMAGFECGYDGMPIPIAYRVHTPAP